MTVLEIAQTLAVLLGALGAVGWVGNTIYQSRRATSENKIDNANAESISVSTLSATIKTLNVQMEEQAKRNDNEISKLQAQLARVELAAASLEARFDRVLDDLHNEKQLAEELAHELERYRLQVAQRDERIADLELLVRSQGLRIDILEKALREVNIDPDEIEGKPI